MKTESNLNLIWVILLKSANKISVPGRNILPNMTSIKFTVFIKSCGRIKTDDSEEHIHTKFLIWDIGFVYSLAAKSFIRQNVVFLYWFPVNQLKSCIFYSLDIFTCEQPDETVSLKAALVNSFLLALVRL